jgi:hypothetical protein
MIEKGGKEVERRLKSLAFKMTKPVFIFTNDELGAVDKN